MTRVAGVDGCPGGWIAVVLDLADPAGASVRVEARFASLIDGPDAPDVVAVDMPIGLPATVGLGGRPAERAVRGMLGPRQSSIFSVPSRAAVMEGDYAAASAAALATSDPPRRISKQAFHLFPKIREIDALMRADPARAARVFETHPEVAFTVLNGGRPMTLPKKVKGSPNPPGLAERRAFLTARGLPAALLDARPPRGAAADDLLDAAVSALVAARLATGRAVAHPAEPVFDDHGLRIAIWA
ncbi:DUF429 domain-containing protein [Mongoliimonas terrestris]|uniref:DUF429 domain-containing protein n=1 Tax=Mongoliimonas terrestris TaxID=1709001 RepID=UPI000949A74E|nr:DUF429 domain-containing protein [Mongoliimonas terrestris]